MTHTLKAYEEQLTSMSAGPVPETSSSVLSSLGNEELVVEDQLRTEKDMTRFLQREVNYCKFELRLRENEIEVLKNALEAREEEINAKYKRKCRELKE